MDYFIVRGLGGGEFNLCEETEHPCEGVNVTVQEIMH